MSERLSSAPPYASDREDPFATPASSLRGSTNSVADNDADRNSPNFPEPEEVHGEQRVADEQREDFYRDALHNIEKRDRKSLAKAHKKAASSSQSSTQPASGQKPPNPLLKGFVHGLAATNPATAAYSYMAPTTHRASISAQAPSVSQMDWRPTTHLVLDERFEVKVTDSGDTEMRAVVDPPYIMTLHSSADSPRGPPEKSPGQLEVYRPNAHTETYRSRKEGQGHIMQDTRGNFAEMKMLEPVTPSSVLSSIAGVTELQNDTFIFELGDHEEVFIINKTNASMWLKKGEERPSYRAARDLPAALQYESLKENRSIPWLEGHTFSRPSTLSRVGKGISSLVPAHHLF